METNDTPQEGQEKPVQEAAPAAGEKAASDENLSMADLLKAEAEVSEKVHSRGVVTVKVVQVTADLVLVDTERPTPVTRARVLSQCGWSPFEGETFRSSIVATLVNGQVVYRDGKVIEARAAMRLQIGPQRER